MIHAVLFVHTYTSKCRHLALLLHNRNEENRGLDTTSLYSRDFLEIPRSAEPSCTMYIYAIIEYIKMNQNMQKTRNELQQRHVVLDVGAYDW